MTHAVTTDYPGTGERLDKEVFPNLYEAIGAAVREAAPAGMDVVVHQDSCRATLVTRRCRCGPTILTHLDLDQSPHIDADDEEFWAGVRPLVVGVGDIVTSQTSLSIAALLTKTNDAQPAHGIRLPDGRVRLVNGHHRFARAVLRDEPYIRIRVVER